MPGSELPEAELNAAGFAGQLTAPVRQSQLVPIIAAALAGSKIVNGRPDMTLRVLLNGKDGSIGEMPPLGQSLSDDQLAQVLTYVRGSFGNMAAPIHPDAAKEFRLLYAYRKKPWTDQELQKPPR